MADDPGHPLRAKAEEGLDDARAATCSTIPTCSEKVEALKRRDDRQPGRCSAGSDGLWQAGRAGLLKRRARSAGGAGRASSAKSLRQIGETLQRRSRSCSTAVNRFARPRARSAPRPPMASGIVRLVSETMRGWDAQTITERLENAVGRDLQYIRINGTLVGGLVGVALHTLSLLL